MPASLRPICLTLLAVTLCSGLSCTEDVYVRPKGSGMAVDEVPHPINLLLPKEIEIHPFTRISSFGGGNGGVHARVKALDSFGAETRAFGNFRFELYEVQQQNLQRRGRRLADWEVNLAEPDQNLLHWDRHTRSYEFKLGWNHNLPPGREVILTASFTSRFTPRLNDHRDITAGQ
ncbi:MAG: hypothetical protein GVY16_10455 [Planctomycetes bacterium]|nr:hypothetical protein [Phycisphaerae bacterium]NBB96143.1 hypothetical protein [Planctomycetota bacterium]